MTFRLQLHGIEAMLERVLEALAELDLAPSIATIQKYFEGEELQNPMAALEPMNARSTAELVSVLSEYSDLSRFLVSYSSYLGKTSVKTRGCAEEVSSPLIRDSIGTLVSGLTIDGRELLFVGISRETEAF